MCLLIVLRRQRLRTVTAHSETIRSLEPVATVNCSLIDRGLLVSTKTHGPESTEQGYPLDSPSATIQTCIQTIAVLTPQRLLRSADAGTI